MFLENLLLQMQVGLGIDHLLENAAKKPLGAGPIYLLIIEPQFSGGGN